MSHIPKFGGVTSSSTGDAISLVGDAASFSRHVVTFHKRYVILLIRWYLKTKNNWKNTIIYYQCKISPSNANLLRENCKHNAFTTNLAKDLNDRHSSNTIYIWLNRNHIYLIYTYIYIYVWTMFVFTALNRPFLNRKQYRYDWPGWSIWTCFKNMNQFPILNSILNLNITMIMKEIVKTNRPYTLYNDQKIF